MKLSIGQFSGAGRKNRNEDSYGILMPDGPLLSAKGVAITLADGMSGSEAAKIASDTCVKGFLTDYYDTPESWSVRHSAEQVLGSLNRWLYSQGQSLYLARTGMISTFSALVLKSGTGHMFHVGDSRIYRLRDGDLEQLTRDHRIQAGADKSYLARGMGAEPDLEVDYRKIALEEGDIFLLATDGVYEFVAANDMVRLVAENENDLDKAAEQLAGIAYEQGSNDNLTCQYVRIDELALADERTYLRTLQDLAFPPPLEPGMILDGYKIQRELYSSKRTQVYLAVDEETGDQVTLKTPSPNYADDPVFIEMFLREEWAGRRVNSPHVLKVLDQTRQRQFLYYVTEYVDGITLRQWSYDHPDPSIAEVRDLVRQIALGLRAMHRREIIHQDLKPENILIDPFGTVKLIDFGSARVAGLAEIETPLEEPSLVGTEGYTAPEYHLGKRIDRRVDLFSLGVIAYELLTGALPYKKGFTNAASTNKLEYVSASLLNPDLPPWIDGALRKAVAKQPNRRYAVLSEFIADLTKPNPQFSEFEARALMERDPVGFWKGVSLLLTIAVLVQLYLLIS